MIDIVEVQADGRHASEQFNWRLNMRCALLDRPRSEARNCDLGTDIYCPVLVPAETPIGLIAFVESYRADRPCGWAYTLSHGRTYRAFGIEQPSYVAEIGDPFAWARLLANKERLEVSNNVCRQARTQFGPVAFEF